jgi:hypothetical protein
VAGARKKLSAKQIKFFGTKRQKSALKRKKTSSAGSKKKNPVRKNARVTKVKSTTRRKASVKRRAKRNPAPFLITLGAVNPKRRTTMAKRRKKARKVGARRRRRTPMAMNPRRRRRVANVRRRSNGSRRKSYGRRRRNPEAFGINATSSKFMQAVAGGLVGVAATKFIPTLVPMNIIGNNNLMRFVVSVASAIVAGMGAKKLAAGPFADGVLFGGLMQAASVGMNTFLPAGPARALALNGMGEFVDGRFVVPQNPISFASPAPAARIQASGLSRSFGTAF